MKNKVTVLALVLVLAFCFVGNAFALTRPYMDPLNPGGEDHPWGGGNEGTSNPTIINGTKTPTTIATGYPVIDFIVNEFTLSLTFRSIFFPVEEQHVYQPYQITRRNFSRKGIR